MKLEVSTSITLIRFSTVENLISHQKVTGTTGMFNVSNCTSYITKIGTFVCVQ
ncbi:hypothetical protein LH398_04350 [Fusobacterium nucleatum]